MVKLDIVVILGDGGVFVVGVGCSCFCVGGTGTILVGGGDVAEFVVGEVVVVVVVFG